MISRNDPCWCKSGKKWKKCHYPTLSNQSSPQDLFHEYKKKYKIILKNNQQIEGIKKACILAANILSTLCKAAKEGVTTNQLNDLSDKLHKEAGAIAAPLGYGYPPFPKGICTSLNEIICHGIPNDIPLKNGDIVNIDVSCILNSFYGDCSAMVMIGDVSEEKRNVCKASYECLEESIKILKPGLPLNAIGNTIDSVASSYGFSVVDQFVGHGIGIDFHEAPIVAHHKNNNTTPLVPGMTFTIEPMINVGLKDGIIDRTNKWEARTVDFKPSAQWEHTLLITDVGYEILTLPTV